MISQAIRENLSARPALVLGIAVGIGALLGIALSSRNKGLVVDVAQLVARLALAGTRGAPV